MNMGLPAKHGMRNRCCRSSEATCNLISGNYGKKTLRENTKVRALKVRAEKFLRGGGAKFCRGSSLLNCGAATRPSDDWQ